MPPRPSRLFHGTASTRLASILKHGLVPGGAIPGDGPRVESDDSVVFLTDVQAIGFARMATHRANMERNYKSETPILPVVLEIDATGLDLQLLKPFQRPGTETIGTCEYYGNVPPALITRTALIDPTKAARLYESAWDAQVARGFAEKTRTSDEAYNAICTELHNLILWLFGEAPPEFSGPPERERAGISVVERGRGGVSMTRAMERTAD
jgi:hypothetical protein